MKQLLMAMLAAASLLSSCSDDSEQDETIEEVTEEISQERLTAIFTEVQSLSSEYKKKLASDEELTDGIAMYKVIRGWTKKENFNKEVISPSWVLTIYPKGNTDLNTPYCDGPVMTAYSDYLLDNRTEKTEGDTEITDGSFPRYSYIRITNYEEKGLYTIMYIIPFVIPVEEQ